MATATPAGLLTCIEVPIVITVPKRTATASLIEHTTPFPLLVSPFSSGSWTVVHQWTGYNATTCQMSVRYGLRWSDVDDRIMLKLGSMRVTNDANVNLSNLETFDPGAFPSKNCGEFMGTSALVAGLAPFDVCIRVKLDFLASEVKTVCRTKVASRLHYQLDTRSQADVRFYFPHAQRELWASSKVLIAASPYFKDLLNGDFAESSLVSERTVIQDPGSRDKDRHFDDSDDEADDELTTPKLSVQRTMGVGSVEDESKGGAKPDESTQLVKSPTSPASSSKSSLPTSIDQFHEIIVKSASYTTYRALLSWIDSDYISFRPLRSSSPSSPSMIFTSPSLPPPASPKSIYRLSDLVSLPRLKVHALQDLKSKLNVDNAATELFGDCSVAYKEIQEKELAFVTEHWEDVQMSQAMKVVENMLENGEGSLGVGAVAVKLAKQLRPAAV